MEEKINKARLIEIFKEAIQYHQPTKDDMITIIHKNDEVIFTFIDDYDEEMLWQLDIDDPRLDILISLEVDKALYGLGGFLYKDVTYPSKLVIYSCKDNLEVSFSDYAKRFINELADGEDYDAGLNQSYEIPELYFEFD